MDDLGIPLFLENTHMFSSLGRVFVWRKPDMKNRDIPNTRKKKHKSSAVGFWTTLGSPFKEEADRTSNSEASHLWIFVQKK